jgi:hypothetical protein
METSQYADSMLERKIDNLTGLVRWHEGDMKQWRDQNLDRHFGIYKIGFGIILVVLIALGISDFHAIKNVENATIGKIDKLQSVIGEIGAVPEFRKFIVEEKPNIETRLAQLEEDNKNLKEEREALQTNVNELRSELSAKAALKSPSTVSPRRSHSANGSTGRTGQ